MTNRMRDEPTETIYVRVPRTVKLALDIRRRRERRSLAMLVSIALEDWLRERGELPIREDDRERDREPEAARA